MLTSYPFHLGICLLSLLVCSESTAADRPTATIPDAPQVLRVGTKEVPPFAMKRLDGTWTGISIELLGRFSRERGLPVEFIELSLAELLSGLADGSLDAVAAALTMTPEREELFDFTHPFVVSGLGIGVLASDGVDLGPVLDRLLLGDFIRVFGLVLIALTLASVLVWILESRKNPEHFGGAQLVALFV